MIEKSRPLRSRKHLMDVASMPCIKCGIDGYTQAAHTNFGKGMGIKACDSQTFPLCVYCHTWLDQSGKLNKDERRNLERSYVIKTRQKMINSCKWMPVVEAAFQKIHKTNGEA